MSNTMAWISIEDELPPHGKRVLATYISKFSGYPVVVVAIRYDRLKEPAIDNDDDQEEDENGARFLTCGWYEQKRRQPKTDDNKEFNFLYFYHSQSNLIREGRVTHWLEFPEEPKSN